jgi:hypothetical protein
MNSRREWLSSSRCVEKTVTAQRQEALEVLLAQTATDEPYRLKAFDHPARICRPKQGLAATLCRRR